MTNRAVETMVILFEIIGTFLAVLILWANEILDIPCVLFGAQPTPINWIEGIIETAVILSLNAIVITISFRVLKKITYLEGLIPVCFLCKRAKVNNEWIPLEVYLDDNFEATFPGGYCPECLKKHYPIENIYGPRKHKG